MSNNTNVNPDLIGIKYPNQNSHLFWVICLFIYLLVVFPKKIFAESFSLGISPSIIAITAKPGSTIETPINLENFSDNPIELIVNIHQFTASKTTEGAISFIESSPVFIKLLPNILIMEENKPIERFILTPKQKKKLVLQIAVPIDQKITDYTFSVIFISTETNTQSEIAGSDKITSSLLAGGIGANVIMSVVNNNSPKAQLIQFSTTNIIQHGPVKFSVNIANTGQHFIAPFGEILIRNMFGQLVGKVELPASHVLTQSNRNLSATWPEAFLLGLYRATLNISASENGPSFSHTLYFLALPYQAILIFLIILAIILLVVKRVNKYLSS
jgi:hypothetical protein